jgi:hypothetical protein
MLHKKSFVRKTRRGNVVKVVREHYLRDDIWCGIPGCTRCAGQQSPKLLLLSKENDVGAEDGHTLPFYALLHDSVLLHQVDLLEHPVRIPPISPFSLPSPPSPLFPATAEALDVHCSRECQRVC